MTIEKDEMIAELQKQIAIVSLAVEMKDEIRFRPGTWGHKMDTAPEFTVTLNQRAKLASELVGRWGMVAAIPDGEDKAGRQKLRMMTEEEMAQRACVTAQCLFQAFEDNQWLYDVPDTQSEDD